ncbi:MAG: phosphotransferase KptA/Tpt1 [Spirosoma sp.]|nr:phosphotransferase KptA/Tpt1 [Spirosoma sp.]
MLKDAEARRLSKFLSLVLRHKPDQLGISLDANGWTDVDTLLTKLKTKGFRIDRDQLQYVVETNNKKRFAFSLDEKQIRANQGHSVAVDLGYLQQQPPQFLYHGTATQFLDLILVEGLKKMGRHHVHLSIDDQTARSVGSRHGRPVVLLVKAGDMAADGHVFYQTDNGVWLTNYVPVAYIEPANRLQ